MTEQEHINDCLKCNILNLKNCEHCRKIMGNTVKDSFQGLGDKLEDELFSENR